MDTRASRGSRQSAVARRARFVDSSVAMCIAVGGIGTLAALLLVVVVLFATALPLLRPATLNIESPIASQEFVTFGQDPTGLILWGLRSDGDVQLREVLSGNLIEQLEAPSWFRQKAGDLEGRPLVSAVSVSLDGQSVVLGLATGEIVPLDFAFSERLTALDPLDVARAEMAVTDSTVVQQADFGLREVSVDAVVWGEPYRVFDGRVLSLDHLNDAGLLAPFGEQEGLRVLAVGEGVDGSELAFAERQIASDSGLALFPLADMGPSESGMPVGEWHFSRSQGFYVRSSEGPVAVSIMSSGKHAMAVWPNGVIDRYELLPSAIAYRESQRAAAGERITCVDVLVGRQTLLVGSDSGMLRGWTIANTDDSEAGAEIQLRVDTDGFRMSQSHELDLFDDPVLQLAASPSSQVIVCSSSDGKLAAVAATTERMLATSQLPRPEAPTSKRASQMRFSPDGKQLLLASGDQVTPIEFDAAHPEASFRAFFAPVWYEGHDRPQLIWQSTSGSEHAEVKLSFVPLIFGTLKATLLALCVAVPVGIFSAIYASEFLSTRIRNWIKPSVELTASIPGVVLGFITISLLASWLGEYLLQIYMFVVIAPIAFLMLGRCWEILRDSNDQRFRTTRFLMVIVCLLPISLAAYFAGYGVEQILFDGSFRQWIGPRAGHAVGGWLLILLPAMLCVAAFLRQTRAYRFVTLSFGTRPVPMLFGVVVAEGLFIVLAVALSYLAAIGLGGLGLDVRSNLLTSYQDRNGLLVGIALGFFIVPIVFTIADDALQAVPNSLRNASAACGASAWQTTVRIVLPSAASGLVSAVMMGAGRAMGETMIVLMAVGNTPLMEWNPFSGLRALTATLATELPEAVSGSTHYRTLFLAALMLFVFTLAVNTLADLIRRRCRNRLRQI